MYTIEDLKNLPSCIKVNEKDFVFRLYVNAWNFVTICYQNVNDIMLKAYSIVIQPNAEINTTSHPFGVSTVNTFDEAYELMYRNMVADGFIDIEEDAIRECVESEEFDESYEEDALKFRDEHFSIEDYDLI